MRKLYDRVERATEVMDVITNSDAAHLAIPADTFRAPQCDKRSEQPATLAEFLDMPIDQHLANMGAAARRIADMQNRNEFVLQVDTVEDLVLLFWTVTSLSGKSYQAIWYIWAYHP